MYAGQEAGKPWPKLGSIKKASVGWSRNWGEQVVKDGGQDRSDELCRSCKYLDFALN